MDNNVVVDYIIIIGLIGFVFGVLAMFSFNVITNHTYMDGQIDCINGKICYELVKQDDNTTKWEKIKGKYDEEQR